MHWKMNSFLNNSQRFRTGRYIGMVIFTISTIGFTASNPIELMARQEPAPAALKPPMGWSSDWAYECVDVRDDYFIAIAKLLTDTGLNKAGYKKFIIECGWELTSKSDGTPRYGLNVFPNGPRSFSDWLKHEHGLDMGLGTWAGNQWCPREAWSTPQVKESSQLQQFVTTLSEWNVAYLIHRPCDMATPDVLQNSERANALDARYIQMQEAMRNVGLQNKMFYASFQHKTLNGLVPFAHQTRPGAYNDLGFLRMVAEKGLELSLTEKRTMLSFWAAAKSPLIFSDRVDKLDQQTIDILRNPGAIAINQDDLGQSITLKRRYPGDMDIWSAPLKDGSTVAVIINWSDTDGQKQIPLADMGFSSARLQDVWSGNDLGKADNTGHGNLFLRLTETKESAKRSFKRFPIETAEVIGPAEVRELNQVKIATRIGPNGQDGVVWNNIPGGQKGPVLLSFDYINAQLPWGNKDHSKLNFKRAVITVNDQDKFQAHFPITGMSWDDVYNGFLISIPLPQATNKIRLDGLDEWAPDIVALSVEQPSAT